MRMDNSEIRLRSVRAVADPAAVAVAWRYARSRSVSEAEGIVRLWETVQRPSAGADGARLLSIIESVSDFVGIADPSGQATYINPAGRALVGMGATDRVTDLTISDFHPPDTARMLTRVALPHAMRNGTWSGESVLLTRGGQHVPVSQILIARRASDGTLDSLATVMLDLRKRKLEESALHRSEERFRTLAEAIDDGFVGMDSQGVIVFVNQRFAEMLGYPSSDLIGRAFLDLVDPDRRDALRAQFGSHATWDWTMVETLLADAHGQTRAARVTLRPLLSADAGLTAICAEVRDNAAHISRATPPQAQEAERQQLSWQLLTTQETERKRIATDLHDGLGQSLSAMKFSVEQALCSPDLNASGEFAGVLAGLVPKFKEVLEEVRRIAMNLRPAMLDDLGILATLSWFLREFEATYRTIAVDRDISITESDIPASLKVSIFRIVQEVMNNVAKHSGATHASVRIERTGDFLRLAIDDNGKGFDPVALAARAALGRGYGLSGLKDRVACTGGTFEMRAAPDEGVQWAFSWHCG
jgi:PAS domain S-box-containing protein